MKNGFDAVRFSEALSKHMDGKTTAEVAAAAGVDQTLLIKLKGKGAMARRRIPIDAFCQLVCWMGADANDFIKREV